MLEGHWLYRARNSGHSGLVVALSWAYISITDNGESLRLDPVLAFKLHKGSDAKGVNDMNKSLRRNFNKVSV